MPKIKLTVKQIMSFGLWEKVCESTGMSKHALSEGRVNLNTIIEFDDEFKKVEPIPEFEVNDMFEFKDYEYTIAAKAQSKNKPGGIIYLIEQRKFGEEQVEYVVKEASQLIHYTKIKTLM